MVDSEPPARSDAVADRFPDVVLVVHCSIQSASFLTDNKSEASAGVSTTKILEVER